MRAIWFEERSRRARFVRPMSDLGALSIWLQLSTWVRVFEVSFFDVVSVGHEGPRGFVDRVT